VAVAAPAAAVPAAAVAAGGAIPTAAATLVKVAPVLLKAGMSAAQAVQKYREAKKNQSEAQAQAAAFAQLNRDIDAQRQLEIAAQYGAEAEAYRTLIPGVSNQTLMLAGAGVLAALVLLGRRR
jgi:hypothetical protein